MRVVSRGFQVVRRLLSRRLSNSVVIALAVIVVALTVWSFLQRPSAPPVSGNSPSEPTSTTRPIVSLWIGDSYTEGTGAQTPDYGYPELASSSLGWVCYLDAQGGTGFINDGHINSKQYEPLSRRLA